jgi:protein-S-isoprenylcysteine O-methyltransferase Ste14
MREVVDRMQDTVGRLAEQMQTLVRLEIQLAKTEIAEKAKSAAKGAAFFAAAGVLLFFAVFGFLVAAIWGLGEFMPIWLAALIVALLFVAGAGLLAFIGLRSARRATPPIPEKAIGNVQPLPHEIKEAAST